MDDQRSHQWTQRERGLMLGHECARQHAQQPHDVRAVAEGESAVGPRAAVLSNAELRARLVASVEPDAEDAFSAGFVRGVGAFVQETHTGTGTS